MQPRHAADSVQHIFPQHSLLFRCSCIGKSNTRYLLCPLCSHLLKCLISLVFHNPPLFEVGNLNWARELDSLPNVQGLEVFFSYQMRRFFFIVVFVALSKAKYCNLLQSKCKNCVENIPSFWHNLSRMLRFPSHRPYLISLSPQYYRRFHFDPSIERTYLSPPSISLSVSGRERLEHHLWKPSGPVTKRRTVPLWEPVANQGVEGLMWRYCGKQYLGIV